MTDNFATSRSHRGNSNDEPVGFPRAGHTPTLLTAFLYFDVSSMIWLLPGRWPTRSLPDFGLSDSQKGLMVAVPLLGGAILRLGLGLLTDRIGARQTAFLACC